MSAKVLITGLPNTGKTSLLKPLKNVLVCSRDGKPFPLPLIHYNVTEYNGMEEFLDILNSKLEAYNTQYNKYPETIVFDSVSRIFTDIEIYCSNRFNGFDVWSNVNKQINMFNDALASLQTLDYNLVLIAHAVWDEKAGKFIETCKGSFSKTGGFLSTVDYAINIDIVGNKRIVTHKGTNLSRTLIEDVPDKQSVTEFNLQEYLDKINKQSNIITEKWSI